MRFYHTRDLAFAPYDRVFPRPISDTISPAEPHDRTDDWHFYKQWETAYHYLESKVGFYPLFMSVDCIWMTGYTRQFERIKKYVTGQKTVLYGPGEQKNSVMFVYDTLPEKAVWTDYDYWHLALNSGSLACHSDGTHTTENACLKPHEERLIFKKSWPSSRWKQKARKEHGSVQIVTPYLDLQKADEVWCRNKQTKRILEKRGFTNVIVKRFSVNAECS